MSVEQLAIDVIPTKSLVPPTAPQETGNFAPTASQSASSEAVPKAAGPAIEAVMGRLIINPGGDKLAYLETATTDILMADGRKFTTRDGSLPKKYWKAAIPSLVQGAADIIVRYERPPEVLEQELSPDSEGSPMALPGPLGADYPTLAAAARQVIALGIQTAAERELNS